MSLHVPEKYRITDGMMGTPRNAGNYGGFLVPSVEPGWELSLICHDGLDPPTNWEHVSVSAVKVSQQKVRIPNWKEMCHIKDLCWDGEDVVIQFHPRKSEYINYHPSVLHMWRCLTVDVPTPPSELVGPIDKIQESALFKEMFPKGR